MKQISIDNGHSYTSVEDAISEIGFDAIANMFDPDICEVVHNELAPCTEVEFLTRYLELSPCDVVIG